MSDDRQYAPATLRNRDFILDVLRDVLPTTGVILEIASGSGEHIVHFAQKFPAHVFQPSDPEPDALLSIAAWVKATRVTNVRAPVALDASQSVWPIVSTDGDHLHQHGPYLTVGGDPRNNQRAAAILPPASPLYSAECDHVVAPMFPALWSGVCDGLDGDLSRATNYRSARIKCLEMIRIAPTDAT